MDPFTSLVNVLTILSAAGQTSIYLYDFFRNIRGAPKEVSRYCSLLEGLGHTFSTLHSLYSDDSIRLVLSGDFSSRLGICSRDLQAIQVKIQKSDCRFKDKASLRKWERVKWTIFSKSWLEKFFSRLQLYHVDFAMERHCAQL